MFVILPTAHDACDVFPVASILSLGNVGRHTNLSSHHTSSALAIKNTIMVLVHVCEDPRKALVKFGLIPYED